jgi:hypothetical protein
MQHNVINNIRLDVNKAEQRVSVSIRKDDTMTRRLDISLVDRGQVIDLTDAYIAVLMAKKPDGFELYNDCVIVGDEIQYSVTTQTINVVGEVECNVQVTYRDGSMVTSPTFIIAVYDPVIRDSVIESTNEYNAIAQFVVQAEQAAETAQQSASVASDYASEATDSATLSESWAAGGTGRRQGEDQDNARFYALQATGAAQESAALRDQAAQAVEEAEGLAAEAAQYATEAEESATTAGNYAEAADQSKNAAKQSEDAAKESEEAAAESAREMDEKVAEAEAWEELSKSYAVGTDGEAREGDETDNAKYYMEMAADLIAGNILATFEIRADGCLYFGKTYFNGGLGHFDFAIIDNDYLEVEIKDE